MDSRLPLFPLSTVLFPGVVLPLRVFEQRYRTLVRDLLGRSDGDPEMGIVAIKVGYEVGEHGVHTVQRTGTSAVITQVDAHDDGTYDLTVVGHRRFHVDSLDTSGPYLEAEVEWLTDGAGGDDTTARLVARTVTQFDRYRALLVALRGDDVLLGETPRDPLDLAYTVAASMVLDPAQRQALLELPDTVTRLRAVSALVDSELATMAVVPSLPAPRPAVTGWNPN